jgi:peptidoglycan/LPS O-acetylase OafA/YrhL
MIRWEPQRRIPSLDALRGIAALAVVVHHAALQRLPVVRQAAYAPDVNIAYPVLFFMGTWGVTLFFVLSGFCIHLPQARKEHEGAPFIGWREFFRRRARRLLPTHYASIACAVIAAYFVPTDLITKPTITTLLAHVLMVHTWIDTVVFYSINAVFWSIAVEVHFYVTYPLLLWIRKKLGFGLLPVLLAVGLFVYGLGYLRPAGDARFVIQHLFLSAGGNGVWESFWRTSTSAGLSDPLPVGSYFRVRFGSGAPCLWGSPTGTPSFWACTSGSGSFRSFVVRCSCRPQSAARETTTRGSWSGWGIFRTPSI